MKICNFKEELKMPEGVTVQLDNETLNIRGEKGEVTRTLKDPRIKMNVIDGKVILEVKRLTKREKTMVGTYKAHIKNMIKGVSEGHVYRMKICSGHFPMNVNIKDGVLEVKNFLGEKVARSLPIADSVDVKIEGTEIVITGTDKEKCGRWAASIEKLTYRPGYDKRVFQDGIYIINKDGKEIK